MASPSASTPWLVDLTAVLMEVANPSSQDRTPRRAIVLAVPPAAAPYRASGLVLWDQTDSLANFAQARC